MLKKLFHAIHFKPRSLSIRVLVRLVAGLCLLLGIGMGVMWYMAGQRNTPEYAIQQINGAIVTESGEILARYVDFRKLGSTFVNSILKYQERRVNESQHRELEEKLQLHVLGALSPNRGAGESAEKSHGEPTTTTTTAAPETATKHVTILPSTLLLQLKNSPFVIQWNNHELAIAAAPFHHDSLNYDGTIKLSLREGPENWMVVNVANADELIQTYFAALKKDQDKKTADFFAENQQRTDTMNSHYSVSSCKAFVAKNIDARSDVPLVITLEAMNTGTQPLLSAGLVCTLTNQAGETLAEVPLNSVRKVDSGKSFQQNWQIELPRSLPQTQILLREKSLSCRTRVSAVSLGDGKIVFLRPEKDLEEILK